MNRILVRVIGILIGINLIFVSSPAVSGRSSQVPQVNKGTNSEISYALASNNSVVTQEETAPVITDEEVQRVLDEEAEQKRQALEDEIKQYLGDNINNVGLSYYDINSGKTIVINGDKTFLAASTFKVQMNMVLFDMIKSGQIDINEDLAYTDDCYEEGTGVLQSEDLTQPFSISLLSQYSIIHSDNIATNMLIKRIGYDTLRNAIDSKLGHATDHSDNYITPNDETTLLKLLYTNAGNNSYYGELINTMKNTDFNDRIDLYVPQNIVSHKVGNYDSYVNDVGIIYTKNPYILSVYTNNVDDANEVIAHISKMIYDYQNSIN